MLRQCVERSLNSISIACATQYMDETSLRPRTVGELVFFSDGGLDLGAQLDLGAEHQVRAVVHQDEVRLCAE